MEARPIIKSDQRDYLGFGDWETDLAEMTIVLPTYNEADNLASLVHGLEQLGEDLRLVIVDDNSTDGTQQVAQHLSGHFGNVSVIIRQGKLGLGSALRLGMQEALATETRFVMTMDADGSHAPGDVVRLLAVMRRGDAEMVQGSRYVAGGSVRGLSLARRSASRAVNLLYHWWAGAPWESTTNFRISSRRAASLVVARAKGRDFEFVPEATLLVLAAGLKVYEVPISFGRRASGRSKLGPRQFLKGLSALFSYSMQYRLRLGRFARSPAEEA